MNVELGRKVPVQVMLTTRLLDRIDAIAARKAKPGEEPNRSEMIREWLGEAVEREEAGQ